jgi:hypothetical protein
MDATASSSASETSSVDSSSSASSSVSESASESSSVSVGESGSTSADTSASGSESGSESATTGNAQSCGEATDVVSCMAASDLSQTCLWLASSTWVGGGDAVCEPIDVGPTGLCAVDEQDDGCGVFAEPTCPDEFTSVWYQEVGLEVGAIEIVSFSADQICDGLGGSFQQCVYDAQTLTFTPPECSCGCPQG